VAGGEASRGRAGERLLDSRRALAAQRLQPVEREPAIRIR